MPPIRKVSVKACSRCKKRKRLSEFYTSGRRVSGAPKHSSWCKACVKVKRALEHKRYWGAGGSQHTAAKRSKTPRTYLAYLLSKARQRKPAPLTLDELELLWEKQDGRCALSGWKMTMVLGQGIIPTNVSLDRIVPEGDYSAENVQLLCRAVNLAKNNLPQDYFVKMCAAIAEQKNPELITPRGNHD
jgi:hypothetical protein